MWQSDIPSEMANASGYQEGDKKKTNAPSEALHNKFIAHCLLLVYSQFFQPPKLFPSQRPRN